MQTVEDKKVEIIARIQKALKQQRIVQAQIPVLKEVNTCKIFDKLHADTGFEQDDVYAGLLRYQLDRTKLMRDLEQNTRAAV